MCRFLVYTSRASKSLLLADVVLHPDHSILRQSYECKERFEHSLLPTQINADGFGIGWYTPDDGEGSCIFTST